MIKNEPYKFACFILCHGRPNNTPTYDTLRKFGYTGDIYIICDDEDKTLDGYKQVFGEESVVIFSKSDYEDMIDTMDITKDKKCAVYARNACFDIAEKLGLDYFCELDDDYTTIPYRWIEGETLFRSKGANLDEVFKAHIEFLQTSDEIYSVAFAQPGDFIGGHTSALNTQQYIRKTMNSWICDVHRRFIFHGTMNDDVNTYCWYGQKGKLFFTFNFIMIDQPETQTVKGGMTDMYLGNGTYMKSFYTVMKCPSFVKIKMMGDHFHRIHHGIVYNNGMPKIVSSRYRRSDMNE